MSLTSKTSGTLSAGATAQFVLEVVNNGPGDADGIIAAVDMPSSFRYKETDSLPDPTGGTGGVRTEALNARVGSTSPTWGYWDLGAPADGSLTKVDITFTVDIEGSPGSYNATPRVQSDTSAGTIEGKPLVVAVSPSAALAASARVTPTSARASQTVTYSLTVSNTGSAPAEGLTLLVALPPVVAYQSTNRPFTGNASETSVTLPSAGSVELFYSGFTLPAASGSGPGYLTITFVTHVVSNPVGGVYPLSAQVMDDTGDVAYLNNAASLSIVGAAFTPEPTLTPAPSS